MLNKELIIQKCKENDACISEFMRLINSETDEEFSEVLLDNLSWLKSRDLIQFIDSKELLKYIGNNNEWICYYCEYVKDRKDLWSKLTKDYWICYYCKHVKDRKDLWTKLTKDEWIYIYCRFVEDRPELWSRLKELKC